MTQQVGDYVVQRLREWGVEYVFGYPGDGINGLIAAFGRADNEPAFIQARHEEMAAFQATGYAKFSGRVGVCTATSGPGAIHLLNGLYDAKLDHVPVVAIVGQTARSAMGGSYQQEVDLQTLYKDVASDYLVEVNVSSQLPNALDRAIRTALARRAPTAVIIPSDLQEEKYTPPGHAFKEVPSSPPATPVTRARPEPDEIMRAADILQAGSRVAILVGQGARGAAGEVTEVAELTGAGVAKALLGKDVLSDDLPFVTGPIGLLGSRPSYEMMRDCDTLLIVGSNFPYSQFLPEPGQARAIQIDIDPTMIGMRYPTEVNLIGDAKATLAELIPLLERKQHRSWRATIEDNVARWWQTVERQSMLDAKPVNPMRVIWELSQRIPENAIVTADSGSSTNWYARCLRMRGQMRGSLSGTLATMGPGVPYAIGAKFAEPGRPAIALVGDGSMQMNGMAEMLTIARYHRQWADPRLIVCVFHNNDLNQVTWELRAMGGAPKFEESQTLPDFSYADFARSAGFAAFAVDNPADLGAAWDGALHADGPALIDVRTDPEVPPIPPHATWEQMRDMAEAVLRGDPNAWHLITQGAKTKAQELIPGTRSESTDAEQTMATKPEQDVVDLLTAQHEEIRTLLRRLRSGHEDKQELFSELVRLLAVHESAEEGVVHPVAKRAVFGAEEVVQPRLEEESEAKRALSELYDLGVDHPEFDARLAEFADAVDRHAAHEEREEFTLLRKQYSATQLERMAGSLRAAEAVAPTRPHPHAGESRMANLVVGPPLALFDRARDAVRDWRQSQGE